MRNRYKISYFPAALTRQPSYVDVLDLATGLHHEFHESGPLGSGTYGEVRLFKHDNDNIAVKSPKEAFTQNISADDIDEKKLEIEHELTFLKHAYQSDYYSLHHYQDPINKEHTEYNYTYRMIVPFVAGMKLNDFAAANITRTKEMAKLILRVAEELQRLHNLNIIHGDIGSRNILVDAVHDDFHVQFIDFGLAYPANGLAIVGFARDTEHPEITNAMADERFSATTLNADPNQDVKSLAVTYHHLLKQMGVAWHNHFLKKYPEISTFITKGKSAHIDERPELGKFITRLKKKVDWSMRLSLPLQNLRALLNHGTASEVRQLLDSKSKDFTLDKLTVLLHSLFQHDELRGALTLINVKKRMPLQTITDLIKQHLNHQDYTGSTLLHLCAEEGNIDLVFILLRFGADVLLKNAHGKLAADNAHAIIKPLLTLATYIAKLEAQSKKSKSSYSFSWYAPESNADILAAAKFMLDRMIDDDTTTHQPADWRNHQAIVLKTPKLFKLFNLLVETQFLPMIELKDQPPQGSYCNYL